MNDEDYIAGKVMWGQSQGPTRTRLRFWNPISLWREYIHDSRILPQVPGVFPG
jgi:hypothetical protein